MVMVWCGSTEVFMTESAAHQTVESFERALEAKRIPAIPPSMVYAYAAIREGIPYANAAPNLSADIPALVELARVRRRRSPARISRTGQTLLKDDSRAGVEGAAARRGRCTDNISAPAYG
jgi:myo-inositol-1-phosphate synthase